MKRLAVFLVLVAAILSLTGCGKGSVTGTVTDSVFGTPLADVSVTVGKVTVKTNAEGKYSVADIGAKSQTITANLTGFKPYTNTVMIEKKQTVVFDIKMVPTTDNKYGMISAYVSEYQGGEALAGATVTYGDQTEVTDENGYFFMLIEDGTESALTVTKEDYATTVVQNFTVVNGEAQLFEIPVRPLFNPTQPKTPPTLTVTGLEDGATVSGDLTITVNMTSDAAPFALYSYISTLARTPRTNVAYDRDTTTFTVDTTNYQNGPNYLRILAYDYNGNGTILFVPFVIDNVVDDIELPGPIEMHAIESFTFGIKVGYYSKQRDYLCEKAPSSMRLLARPNGAPIDLNTVPADTTFYTTIMWTPAANANGYSLYRSFDGNNYTWIGNMVTTTYSDYSPLLTPGQKVWYKIEPYNSFGKGEAAIRSIETLPSYKIFLKTPQNKSNNVSLTPTFTWEIQATGTFPADTDFYHIVTVYDATNYQILEALAGANYYVYPGQLSPGYVYSWDIYASNAELYLPDPVGYSYACSFGGGYDYWNDLEYGQPGSVNGEFYFTTAVPVQ